MNKSFLISLMALAMLTVTLTAVHAVGEGARISIDLLNYNPNPTRAGTSADVHFRLDNQGDGTQNLQVELLSTYPFTTTGKSVQNITLGPYQTGNNYIDLDYAVVVDKNAEDGIYDMKIRYRPDSGDWITGDFNVSVTSSQFAQIIYVDKARLDPGKETPMNFTITNIGSAALQNLVFSWSDKNGYVLPVFGDNTKYIKYLDVGQSAKLTYTVIADVNAPTGLDQLTLNLNYQSAATGTQSVLTTTAGVFIGGQTDFDVSFSESSQGQTSLSVANTGNNPALAVKVSIPPQPDYQVTGSSASIIGNLNKGDYTLVSFQIVARNFNQTENFSQGRGFANGTRAFSGASSNTTARATAGAGGAGRNLIVNIEYTDPTGTRQLVEKSVPVQFRGSTGTGSLTGQGTTRTSTTAWWQSPYVIVLLLVIIAVGGYTLYRRRGGGKKEK